MTTKTELLNQIKTRVATLDKRLMLKQINATLDHAIKTIDAKMVEGDKWITTESGSHILVDGEGHIKGGAGGKFNGKKIHEMGTGKGQLRKTDKGTQRFVSERTYQEREKAKQQSASREQGKQEQQKAFSPKEQKAHDLLKEANLFDAKIENNSTIIDDKNVNYPQQSLLKSLGFKKDGDKWVSSLNGAKKINEYVKEKNAREVQQAEYQKQNQERIDNLSQKQAASNKEKDAFIAEELKKNPLPMTPPTNSVKQAMSKHKSIANAINGMYHQQTNSDWYKQQQEGSKEKASANSGITFLKNAMKDSGVNVPDSDLDAYRDFRNKAASTEIPSDYEGVQIDTPYKFFRALYDDKLKNQINVNITSGSEKQNKYATDIVKNHLFDMAMKGKSTEEIDKAKSKLSKTSADKIIQFQNHLNEL